MATDPTEAIRALRRQLSISAALGHSLGHEPDAEIINARHELDDEVDEELDPSPKRKAIELSYDDGRSR